MKIRYRKTIYDIICHELQRENNQWKGSCEASTFRIFFLLWSYQMFLTYHYNVLAVKCFLNAVVWYLDALKIAAVMWWTAVSCLLRKPEWAESNREHFVPQSWPAMQIVLQKHLLSLHYIKRKFIHAGDTGNCGIHTIAFLPYTIFINSYNRLQSGGQSQS